MSRTKKILLAVCAVAVLGVLVGYGYILFVKDDAEKEFDTTTLDERISSTTTILPSTSATSASSESAPSSTAAEAPATTQNTGEGAGDPVSGTWVVAPDSEVGYRVSEVLGGIDTTGSGRTNQVSGTLTIAGTRATAAEFTVDMASITSDSDRRDGQFRTRIMTVDEFPTATFVLTQPIDFGTAPAEGAQITASATGDLTLRGVTKTVTFDLTAQYENGRVGVLGNIPILFSDYEIPDPSNGIATVKDNGSLEFVLLFDKA